MVLTVGQLVIAASIVIPKRGMSAAVAVMGLVVASTVLMVVMREETQKRMSLNAPDNTNYSALLDPKGPDVQFVLFNNGREPFNLICGDYAGFENSGFDANITTKIIIHGFLSGIRQEVFFKTKNAYLETGDYNVIGMDWSVLCEFEYFTAMKGAQLAGDALGNFLKFIIRAGILPEDIHIIGHSLGAHVAGMGADAVTTVKIGRITGLDPAGPGYSDVPTNLRLDPGDAQLVDIIHTYMRVLSLTEPLGHVDFYPNGGRYQPGCPELFDIWKVPESISCNHGRAYMYFIESIYNKLAFRSQKCANVEEAISSRCFEESDVLMGQPETYKVGLYYVKTNIQAPFSLT